MSRMVRENTASGLRERLWFAQWTWRQLQQARAAQAPRGELLAQRNAVILHAYSVLVALARSVVADASAGEISLPALLADADSLAVVHPALQLLAAGCSDAADPLYWLQQQTEQVFAAAGLAHRPVAREADSLAMTTDDPYQLLADGDMLRLDQLLARLTRLLAEATTLMEEW